MAVHADRDLAHARELVLEELPHGRRRHALLSALGLRLRTSFAEMSRLTHTLPARLSVFLDETERDAVARDLQNAGASFHFDPTSSAHTPCRAHAKLGACQSCADCAKEGCSLCIDSATGTPRCPACQAKARRRRRFFVVRLSVLSFILVVVLLWGLGDLKSRRARNDWERPVNVAIILVTRDDIGTETVAALRARLPMLESTLQREASLRGLDVRPFRFVFYGPARAGPSPRPPSDDGVWSLVKHTYRQWRYVRSIDRALGVESSAWDSRIYLVARQPRDEGVQFVEGYGQAGGRIGVVEVELTTSMVDTVLAVAVHELFHTLGAEDKYGPDGRALIPHGLARPKKRPVFPQSHVEVMARGRPLDGQGHEAQLESLQELGVGPSTAQEIGWLSNDD